MTNQALEPGALNASYGAHVLPIRQSARYTYVKNIDQIVDLNINQHTPVLQ